MMLPRSNVHTHSIFSDGANTVEEMVQFAIAHGFTSIGFSDHGACKYDAAGMRDESGYREQVRRLQRQYAGKIEIALGYEHDSFTLNSDLSHYDYIIESVHFLHKGGDLYIPIDFSAEVLQRGINELYEGDPYAMCRDYFENVNRSMLNVKADVVGHIGLITKFNEKQPLFDHQSPKYLRYADETIALAAEQNILVEINSGAMSRGYRTSPYPYIEQLRLLKKLGGRITITSDCHRAEWIDYGFDVSVQLAKQAGFTETWIWENGGFVAKPLFTSHD